MSRGLGDVYKRQDDMGKPLNTVEQVNENEHISLIVRDGRIKAKIDTITKGGYHGREENH